MNFRPNEEVREAFDAVASLLDADLNAALPALLAEGVSVISYCNRTGFDPTGYGWPRWSHRFERRSASVSPLCLVAVEVSYDEPIDLGARGKFRSKAVAEAFPLGSPISLFRMAQPLSLGLDDLSGGQLLATVRLELIRAADPMPAELRRLLEDCAPAVSSLER